jgi:hypothetical protein
MPANKELEDYLNSIPGLPPEPRRTAVNNQQPMNREIDVGSMLQQRLMQRMTQGNNDYGIDIGVHMPGAMQSQQSKRELVYLREGQTYYKAVPTPESPMPIAIMAGPIANSVGKEFINKGASKYYVVEGHQAVDLSNPDYSKMKLLYAVEAPWVGTILVPESALIKKSNNPGRPQVLKG